MSSKNQLIHINRTELLRLARQLDQDEMISWIRQTTGQDLTVTAFRRLMFQMLPLEQAYQTEVLCFVSDNYPGAFVWKASAGPYSRQGIPDVCAIIDGHFFGFEIKRPYIGEATEIQKKTIRDINAAGGTASVISFRHEAKEVIDKWMSSQKKTK